MEVNQFTNSTKWRHTWLAPMVKNRSTFIQDTIHKAVLPTHLAGHQQTTTYK